MTPAEIKAFDSLRAEAARLPSDTGPQHYWNLGQNPQGIWWAGLGGRSLGMGETTCTGVTLCKAVKATIRKRCKQEKAYIEESQATGDER